MLCVGQQMNACSSLTLIAACVIYWQAREITRVLKNTELDPVQFDPNLISHISPIGWDNVILYGQYHIDPRLIR